MFMIAAIQAINKCRGILGDLQVDSVVRGLCEEAGMQGIVAEHIPGPANDNHEFCCSDVSLGSGVDVEPQMQNRRTKHLRISL